jgi:hypothetical protein
MTSWILLVAGGGSQEHHIFANSARLTRIFFRNSFAAKPDEDSKVNLIISPQGATAPFLGFDEAVVLFARTGWQRTSGQSI